MYYAFSFIVIYVYLGLSKQELCIFEISSAIRLLRHFQNIINIKGATINYANSMFWETLFISWMHIDNEISTNLTVLLLTFKQVFIIFYKMLRYIIFKSSYNICTVITLFCGKTKHMVTYNGRKVPSFFIYGKYFLYSWWFNAFRWLMWKMSCSKTFFNSKIKTLDKAKENRIGKSF